MAKKILVVYASRGGSTMEVADKIAEELSSQGDISAEVISVKKAKDIASYDAIVLGSAILDGASTIGYDIVY
jgi:menaquinone-dependent protoporphyrinogen oxidase